MTTVGDKVRIIEDCRDGIPATGQTGIYEGRFPIPGNEDRYPDNPRIRLDDGSVIWGAECWWEGVTDDMPSLEEAQGRVREYQAHFSGVVAEFYERVAHSVYVSCLGRRNNKFLRWQRKQIPLNFVQRAARRARLCADAERFGYERVEGADADS